LKGRDERVVAAWRTIEALTAAYVLKQVDLRGVVRRTRPGAVESGDIARDISRINDTLEDSYSVPQLALRPIASEAHSSMLIDFAAATVTSGGSSPSAW